MSRRKRGAATNIDADLSEILRDPDMLQVFRDSLGIKTEIEEVKDTRLSKKERKGRAAQTKKHKDARNRNVRIKEKSRRANRNDMHRTVEELGSTAMTILNRGGHAPRAGNSEHPNRRRRRRRAAEEREAQKNSVALFSEDALMRKQEKARKRRERKIRLKNNASLVNSLRREEALERKHQDEDEKIIIQPESMFMPSMDTFSELYNILPDGTGTCLNVVAYLYLLYRARSKGDVIAATVLFFNGVRGSIDPDLIESYSESLITSFKLFTSGPSEKIEITPESFTLNFIDDAQVFLAKVLSSDFITILRRTVLSVVSFHVFPKWVQDYVGSMSTSIFESSGIVSVLLMLVEDIRKLISYGASYFDGVPLTDIMMSENPVGKAISDANWCVKYQALTYDGLPREGFVDRNEFLLKIRDVIVSTEHLLGKMKQTDVRKRTMSNLLPELITIRSDLENANRGVRPTPIAICIHGPPGVGKGRVLLWLAKAYCETRGRVFREGCIFSRVVGSDYWEQYDPIQHTIIHYSEVACLAPKIVERMGDPALTELLGVIDSLPKVANMAFGQKGKVNIRPELVLSDTNDQDMNIKHLMNVPSAVYRRFLYIGVSVKPEFRKTGSTEIDPAKSFAAGGNLMDRYEFIVSIRKVTQQSSGAPTYQENIEMTGDIYALASYLQNYFIQKVSIEETSYSLRNTDVITEDLPDEEKNTALITTESFLEVPPAAIAYAKDFADGVITVWVFIATLTLSSFMNPKDINWNIVALFSSSIYCFAGMKGLIMSLVSVSAYAAWLRYHKITKWIIIRNVLGNVKEKSLRRLKYLLNLADLPNTVSKFWCKEASYLVSIIAALTMIKKMFFSKKVEVTPEGMLSKYIEPSPHDVRLRQVEEQLDIKPKSKRLNKKGTIWNEVETGVTMRPVFTEDSNLLHVSLSSNIRAAKVKTTQGIVFTYIFGLKGTMFVMNRHSLRGCDSCELLISNSRESIREGNYRTITVNPDMYVTGNHDMLIVDSSNLHFKDALKHCLPTVTWSHFKGNLAGRPVETHLTSGGLMRLPGLGLVEMDKLFEYEYKEHYPGICGLPLFVQANHGSYLAGFHTGGVDNDTKCYALPLFFDDVSALVKTLEGRMGLLGVNSQNILPESKLDEPIRKSPLWYEHFPNIDLYGKIEGPVLVNNKSRLIKSKFHDVIWETFDKHGLQCSEVYAPPAMRPFVKNGEYISLYNNFLRKVDNTPPPLRVDILNKCVSEYTSRIISHLPAEILSPLTFDDAVNGIAFDDYTRRINVRTSSGFGFKGTKEAYLPIMEEDEKGLFREAVDEVRAQLVDMSECYTQDLCSDSVFVLCPKDEPREISKVHKGATRLFNITPLALLIKSRQVLSPFYTRMVEYSDAFCTAVGINMHGEGGELIKKLNEFSPYIMEGDYSAYDVSNPPMIARAANTIVYDVCDLLGYSPYALKEVKGVLSDGLFCTLELNKDIMVKAGLQPSGKYATAEDNSLRGVLMLMYAWYSNPVLENVPFFDNVLPIVYGDDMLAAVKPEYIEYFNNNTYQEQCMRLFNMKFTSASKSDSLEPYMRWDECSFLKRTFWTHPEGEITAKLNCDSIAKSLMWVLPSHSISECDQMAATINSALWELYFHFGESDFNAIKNELVEIFQEYYTDSAHYAFANYYDIRNRVLGLDMNLGIEDPYMLNE